MKKIGFFSALLFLSFIISCGGEAPGPAVIDGPELSLSEAQDIELNQLYVKNWGGSGSRPFFSVYIQDGLSDDYMVCVGPEDGLDLASRAGVYYGKLSMPMNRVNGANDHNTPLMNVIVVADQKKPCPEPLADDDMIIGSAQINFSELLDRPINIQEGTAYVTFRARGHEDVDIADFGVAAIDALSVGEVYFTEPAPIDVIPNYYLVLYVSNGSVYEYTSMVGPDEMPEMREPNIIYSWLDLPFSGTEGMNINDNLLNTKAKVELRRDEDILVGKTSAKYVADIVGQKIDFLDGKGYLKFRRLPE